MNDTNDPLSQLRDIHLPEPVSFWPPAPGWWVLLALLILVCLAAYWAYKRHQRPDIRKAALDELEGFRVEMNLRDASHNHYVELSILLRRIAITIFGNHRIAGLSGEKWLKFLDETGGTDFFSTQCGQVLTSAPYVKNMSPASPGMEENRLNEIELLLNEIKNWVVKNT